jgi:hypothetical protein
MNKFIYLFRKFATYILFISTVLSFIFSEDEFLSILFISIAFIAFFKINFIALFKKKRYLSKLELFFTILLFIKIYLLFDLNLYYKFLSYFFIFFFLLFYFLYFSNDKNIKTNILGVKKNKNDDNFEDDLDLQEDIDPEDDSFSDTDSFLEDDQDFDDDFSENEENDELNEKIEK